MLLSPCTEGGTCKRFLHHVGNLDDAAYLCYWKIKLQTTPDEERRKLRYEAV
jgi:hypothetical protein